MLFKFICVVTIIILAGILLLIKVYEEETKGENKTMMCQLDPCYICVNCGDCNELYDNE